jgi:predicted component of viral defense system (DUF524 family)
VVARVRITPDSNHTGPDATAPLVRLNPEAATEHGEAEIQLREAGRYEYEVDCGSDPRDLRLRQRSQPRLVRRRTLRGNQADAGRIETGNYCGTLLLEIVEGPGDDEARPSLATALVEVRSIKLAYRSEYRGMLRSLAEELAALVVDARSSAKLGFHSNFQDRDEAGWFQVQLELLREILEGADFAAALQRILTYPHETLEQELQEIPIDRPFKWTPKAVQRLVTSHVRRALPEGHPLRVGAGLETVASRVLVVRKTPTLDTAENRFLQHALRDFHGFLVRAGQAFDNASGDWAMPAGLARRLALGVEQWLSRSFFREVGPMETAPLGSPVLQRKAGYREVLRWWLRFRTAAELSWEGGEDLFRAGQRNVADLYEYWLFFALLKWFRARFASDGAPLAIEDLLDGLDEGSPNLRLKKQTQLGPFSGAYGTSQRKLNAMFCYNRHFEVTLARHEGGSWTRKMHPDYTLTFWPAGLTPEQAEAQELLVHVHFDAKYRVEDVDRLFGNRDMDDADEEDAANPGNYKRQDLLKMHAYRDAIKRSEGAYVLYPGDQLCRDAQHDPAKSGADRWPHTMWGFHEILPGLGAFALAPDDAGNPQGMDHLERFLDEVLENLCNRAAFRERRASALHEALRQDMALRAEGQQPDLGGLLLRDAPELDADNLRLPPAPEMVVIVGWVRGWRHLRWVVRHDRIVLRLTSKRGALPLIKSLAAASHILLHGPGGHVVRGLWRISADPGTVRTRAVLERTGWPRDRAGGRKPDDLFAVFNVARDPAFKKLRWDGVGLNRALVRFLNRQRPTYKAQLTRLTRDFAKPFLVSVADLQEAIVASD